MSEPHTEHVHSYTAHSCGCRETVFVGGRTHFDPCVPCALRQAANLLIAASDKLREEHENSKWHVGGERTPGVGNGTEGIGIGGGD